jgi:hypothetical protein
MVTIGIGTGLWGKGYEPFLPEWWKGVESLNRQPDDIVFIHDSAHSEYVLNSIPERYKAITRTFEMSGEFAEFMRAMATHQTSDWYSLCGVDNVYLPSAFDQIEQADAEGCDIYIDKLQLKHDGSILSGSWIPELIPEKMTCPGAAPIKRELFLKTGGPTKGSIFDDWELYIRAVAAGAKPFHADTIRCIYDMGYGRQTMSGVNKPADHWERGNAHIRKVRKELGL